MQICNAIVGGLMLATLLHISVVLSKSIQKTEDGDVGTNSFTYLGSVEGKSFFYERYPARTWFEAKEACNATNMQLASITSENEAQFLTAVNNMENYTDHVFWNCGRDSQQVSQYLWDTNNQTVSNHGLAFVVKTSIQTCLAFYPGSTGIGYLSTYMCTQPWGTLCEIHHA